MASLIPGFEFDIFISYRQKDNKGNRWVSEFVKALQIELDVTFKESISIYFDENPDDGLNDHNDVNESLKDKLNCLVFIPILSQTYCDKQSFAYEHEFKEFKKQASSDRYGLKVKLNKGNVASRVLPIRIHDLDHDDILQFEAVTGSPLRSIDFVYKESGVNRPLNYSDNKNDNLNKTDYKNQVNKTANAIKEILTALRSPASNKPKIGKEDYPGPVTDIKKSSKKKIVWRTLGVVILLTVMIGIFQLIGSKKGNLEIFNKSIAVLPFGSINNDPEQESFSDGMMEEIVDHLYKISDLKVVPLASSMHYKESKLTVNEIARKLHVASILYISVWKSGGRIKIVVNMVDALNDRQLWTEPFERELKDIFAIQSEVAQTVASILKVRISNEVQNRISEVPTRNAEAYALYLQAHRLVWNEDYTDKNFKATRILEQVIILDPHFAPAYAELGAIWLFRGMNFGYLNSDEVIKQALPLLVKAVSLDPNLVDAHAYLALFFLDYKWDFETAGNEWNKVFELSPSNTFWPGLYNDFLQASGRFKESLEMTSRILEIDKTNSGNWISAAESYYSSGQTDKAIQIMNETMLSFPENANLLIQNIELKVESEHYSDAVENVNSLLSKFPNDRFPRYLCYCAIVFLKTGQSEKIHSLLTELIEKSKVNSVGSPTYYIAQIYSVMGKRDSAFLWLEKAFTNHEMEMFWLKVQPTLKPLHADPRWAKLIDKMAFPKQDTNR